MTTGHSSLIGKKLGKFEIRSMLGQGGMATVYLAYQADIDRQVAVKVLPPHPGQDPQFMERFQQEARTIARLQHPHILPVFEFGVDNGILFLVMPYVAGGSLKDLMIKARLSPEQVVKIIENIGSAVDYAHRQGIVHRDIKPDNILLDAEGYPTLTDFGIAKMLESNVQFTASGGFLGTPAYMAPEQGRGIKDIDGRADIYALGVLAFEMLTGRHPYSAETPMMVMFKHVSDPVPSLLEVTSQYPAAVDLVLQKALAKNREDRYQTAGEFAKALANALTGQSTFATVVDTTNTAMGSDGIQTMIVNPTEAAGRIQQPTQVYPPATPTLPPQPASKQNSSLLLGGIAVIALLILAGVIFLIVSNGQEDEEAETTTNAPIPIEETEESAPTQEAVEVAAVPNFGTIQFNTTNVLGDTIALNVNDLAQPGENQQYHSWLFSQMENRWLLLGTLPVDVFGKGVLTFTSPEGESLYTLYDAVAVSLEAPDEVGAEPKQIAYSGVLPAEVALALQQILVQWIPDDPNRNPQALSLVEIALAEYNFAADHAGRALSGAQRGSAPNTRVHGEHVYNILNGTTEDINGDNSSGNNPSNLKIGLLPALTEIDNLLLAAQDAAGITPQQQAQIVTVITCAENALFPLQEALEQARTFANIQDAEIANAVADLETWTQQIAIIGAGEDLDADNSVEPIEGECGIEGIRQFALFMNTMTLSEGSFSTEN